MCAVPPSCRIPKGISTALSNAFAVRKMSVTGSRARATGCARSARIPSARSRATVPARAFRFGPPPPDRDVGSMAAADSR